MTIKVSSPSSAPPPLCVGYGVDEVKDIYHYSHYTLVVVEIAAPLRGSQRQIEVAGMTS